MTLNLNIPDSETQLKPRITVIGVGGAGGNAVNNMIQSNLEGVEFVVANTDSQALAQSLCNRTIQLGRNITQGLGSGSRPDIGRAAAEEAMDEILADFDGANMVFITAGMGGGTGTGGAPVIARAAREQGILTVGVITKPFHFEGIHRMRLAESGIQELTQYVDTLIIIPNQNLFRIANEKTTFADAFKMADDVLHAGVRGVTDLMIMPGLINLDFADIRTVMTEMGKAMMGTGEAEGDNRAIAAAEAAISNPLLEDVSMQGARGVLINITGGPDLTLFEVDEAANRIRDEVDPEANIIFGSTYDDRMEGKMRVSVVSTGIDAVENAKPRPVTLSLVQNQEANAGTEIPAAEGGSLAADTTAADVGSTTGSAEAADSKESHASQGGAEEWTDEDPLELSESSGATAESESGKDAFIAPKPMEPESSDDAANTTGVAGPDPFAAADLVNGPKISDTEAAKAPESSPTREAPKQKMVSPATRTRAQTILARMSGAARAIGAAAQGQDEVQHEPSAKPEVRREEPKIERPKTEEIRTPASPANTAEVQHSEGQPRLTGLDPSDRPAGGNVDDDLLDIPAFLRRQAN